jgi:hypothetical protein
MNRTAAVLALALLPGTGLAQDTPPLTAEAFEALVEGKTMDTHDQGGSYGVETFLPGRRAIWRDAVQCLEGTWRPQDDMICFDYIGEPWAYCWTYHDMGDALMGLYEGNPEAEPIMLYPTDSIVTCDGFLGA